MCAWCPAVSPGIGPPYNLTYAHTHPTDRPTDRPPFTGTQTRLVVGHQAVHDRSSPAPDRDNRRDLRPPSRRHGSVVSPSTECSSTMAAMGPGASGVAKTCPLAGTHHSTRSGGRETLCCGQGIVSSGMQSVGHVTQAPSQTARGKAEGSWGKVAGPLQSVAPTMPICNLPANMDIPYSFRSPESVEMDEIMAAMVLTSLSCSPVVQSPPQTHHGPAVSSSSADMECGGEELSDSGSSGYWSWDHGNVSPAPSPSVTEMDSSPDEGLQLELEQGEEFNTRKAKSSIRGMYKCLWPGCGKVLAASVGMKRHIRLLHLGSVSDQSQREEDFYYTKIPCEAVDTPPPLQAAIQAPTSTHIGWASCSSPSSSEIQVLPAPRPRSNSSSGPGPGRPSTLSQSAPSSFWQIHSEHLYQACSPLQLATASPPSRSPASQGWVPFVSVSAHDNSPVVKPRFRSVSVGEQWLQQNSAANRLQTMSASPSRSLCSFRKGRGDAKKCRKVYGVERKDQWCTACRWKKACQRFPD